MGRLDATFAAEGSRDSMGEHRPSRAAGASCKVICSGHRLESYRAAIKVSHGHTARANSTAGGSMKRVPRCKVTQIPE